MVKIRKLLGAILNLRNHRTQISQTDATIKELNRLTKLSIFNTKVSV
ncbi:hypothetical protein [Candidatus Enterovibrio altilux]|nr:hypothetical protein [Candidatus Enterovibrio luxaltus]